MPDPDELPAFDAASLRAFSRPLEGRTDEERALETILDIQAGVNPALASLKLANDFTDRQAARLKAWIFRP